MAWGITAFYLQELQIGIRTSPEYAHCKSITRHSDGHATSCLVDYETERASALHALQIDQSIIFGDTREFRGAILITRLGCRYRFSRDIDDHEIWHVELEGSRRIAGVILNTYLHLCRGTDKFVDTFQVFRLHQSADQHSGQGRCQFLHVLLLISII